MGIGPSTKETSLHHFRDPLLDVVSSDEDLDLMGIIIVGTPDENCLLEPVRQYGRKLCGQTELSCRPMDGETVT